MLERKLFSTQENWIGANQDEIINQLSQYGIIIDTSKPENCSSYIITRDRRNLVLKPRVVYSDPPSV